MIDEKKILRELNEHRLYSENQEKLWAEGLDYFTAGRHAISARVLSMVIGIIRFEAKEQREAKRKKGRKP